MALTVGNSHLRVISREMHKFWSSTCLKLILMSMLCFTFWMFLKFSSPSTFSGFPFGFWCF